MNIKDSLLFLKICRNTIYEMTDNQELKYFIHVEASDYQIMNVIVNNEIPLEKYNIKKEYKLWEQFHKLVYEYDNKMYKLIHELGPISKYNLSSSKVILEFITEAGDQQSWLQGLHGNMKKAVRNSKSLIKKGSKAAAKLAVDTASKGSLSSIAVGVTGAAAVSLVAFAATKIYKNYLDKAARMCKGKPDKAACLKSQKDKALRLRMQKLKSGLGVCAKAQNSENCKDSLQKKIGNVQNKLTKL